MAEIVMIGVQKQEAGRDFMLKVIERVELLEKGEQLAESTVQQPFLVLIFFILTQVT